jgi:hypothetical protein
LAGGHVLECGAQERIIGVAQRRLPVLIDWTAWRDSLVIATQSLSIYGLKHHNAEGVSAVLAGIETNRFAAGGIPNLNHIHASALQP